MAGFLLHSDAVGSGDPWPVSLSTSTPCVAYAGNGFRLATIETADPGAAGCYSLADGVAWIEGNFSPPPGIDDDLDAWLRVVDGSFRGVFFPGDGSGVELLADPYGSRPVFYTLLSDCPAASDKVVSLLGLDERLRSLCWDVLLEALAMGCVLGRPQTSVENVLQVEAGCRVRLAPGIAPAIHPYRSPPDNGIRSRGRSLWGDATAVGQAVQRAVTDRWTDPSTPMLLSGGFDSRWALQSGGSGRRAITLAPGECRELDAARSIALSCGATHDARLYGSEKWSKILADGFLLTGGMFDPLKTHFLADAAHMAQDGIRSVAHAFLFDTLLKGSPYFVFEIDAFESFDPDLIPPKAYMNGASVFTPEYLRALTALLSDTGRALLREQLHRFDAETDHIPCNGFEFGIEKRVQALISRQIDMPLNLSLMEHLGVAAPIFHSELWTWWRESRPDHRKPCTAYLLGLLRYGGRTAWIPKGDTGERAALMCLRSVLKRFLPARARSRSRAVVAPVDEAVGPSSESYTRSDWGVESTVDVIRGTDGAACVDEGLAALEGLEIFDHERLAAARAELPERMPFDFHLVTFLMSIGQLRRYAQTARVAGGDPQPDGATRRDIFETTGREA